MQTSIYSILQADTHASLSIANAQTLVDLLLAIEGVVAQCVPGAVIAVGQQRFSHLLSRERSYQDLAQVSRKIRVFGLPDVTPPRIANISFTPLQADSPLLQEWFLAVSAPDLTVALAADIQRPVASAPGTPRRFRTLLSANPALVDTALAALYAGHERPYQPPPSRDMARQQQNLLTLARQLIQRQERRQAQSNTARQSRLIRSTAQARMLQELSALMPSFTARADWANLLATHIQQVASGLHTQIQQETIA